MTAENHESRAEKRSGVPRSGSHWMRALWRVWPVYGLAALALIVFGALLFYPALLLPCDAVCLDLQLTPGEVAALRAQGASVSGYALFITLVVLLDSLIALGVAALLAWRRPAEKIALLIAYLGATHAYNFQLIGALVPAVPPSLRPLSAVPDLIIVFSLPLLLATFPDGRFVPRWTRWLALVFIATVVPVVIGESIMPAGLERTPAGRMLSNIAQIVAVMIPIALASCQVYRYRRASTIVRQQIKWFVYGAIISVIVGGAPDVIAAAIPAIARPGSLSAAVLFVVGACSPIILLGCITVAILRSRLFDIDIIIRRTLVYGALTLTLGLVYIGCILLSRTLVAPYFGGSEVAIVASTLMIAALFSPLRRRIQNLIDKRFYRRKYDAAKVLAAFGATVRDETNLDALTAELLGVVDETVQPEFVGLWLRENRVPPPNHSSTQRPTE